MDLFDALAQSGPVLRGAIARGNLRVVRSMLGPAYRGLVDRMLRPAASARRGRSPLLLRRGSAALKTSVRLGYSALFDWRYSRTDPAVAKLYEAAKTSQWNSNADLDWTTSVDPEDPEKPILPDSFLPLAGYQGFEKLEPKQKAKQDLIEDR